MSGWEKGAVARYTAGVRTLDAPLERPAARSFASRERSSSIASLVGRAFGELREERKAMCACTPTRSLQATLTGSRSMTVRDSSREKGE